MGNQAEMGKCEESEMKLWKVRMNKTKRDSLENNSEDVGSRQIVKDVRKSRRCDCEVHLDDAIWQPPT